MFETIKRYITPTESFSSDEAKKFITEHNTDEYTILDVRQPGEYEESHLPGAKLIPIGQLGDRISELDPEKPVMVY